MTRYERKRKRNTVRRSVLALFLFVVPLAAIAASVFFMNMYNSRGGIAASADGTPSNSSVAFKYNYEIESKTIYRIELQSSESFEEAEAYVKSIKAKKLNGFILKEDGYKVIFGVFTNNDEAGRVQDSIAGKAKSSISELKLPSYSLKYNDDDNTFIQLVQATDQLIWEVIKSKSGLTHEMALKSKNNPDLVFAEISDNENKLQKYLGYAQKLKVSDSQKTFRENLTILLEEVLTYKVEKDSDKDYYRVQGGLLNQIEAYRRFIEKLSI